VNDDLVKAVAALQAGYNKSQDRISQDLIALNNNINGQMIRGAKNPQGDFPMGDYLSPAGIGAGLGGLAGYFLSDDEDKKLRNALLMGLLGLTGGVGAQYFLGNHKPDDKPPYKTTAKGDFTPDNPTR
jgi:hypothetical protein